jgi:hypothetical protein
VSKLSHSHLGTENDFIPSNVLCNKPPIGSLQQSRAALLRNQFKNTAFRFTILAEFNRKQLILSGRNFAAGFGGNYFGVTTTKDKCPRSKIGDMQT